MAEEYTFNEEKGRYEPEEKKCAFCENGESTLMKRNYFVPIFREGKRNNLIVIRRVKYEKLEIGVPRCTSCTRIHENSNLVGWFLAIVLVLLVIILSFTQLQSPLVQVILTCIALVGGLGFFPGYFENKYTSMKNVKTKIVGTEENNAIQLFLMQGWTLEQPSA